MFGRAICVVGIAFAGCGGGSSGNQDGGVDADVDAAVDAPPDAPPSASECRDDWCWVYPLPQGNDLRSIWGFSANDVWAVGEKGTILHYDGSTWTTYVVPGLTKDLISIYGASPNDIWASGQDVLLHWDGTSWTAEIGSQYPARFLMGSATNDVWMYAPTVGGALHWDGSQWSGVAAPSSNWKPLGFWTFGASTYSVSDQGAIAVRTGNTWGFLEGGSHPAKAAALIDATHLVLVNGTSTLQLWDGQTWSTRTSPSPNRPWLSVSARSFNDIWVGGGKYRAHWDGSTWTETTINGVIAEGFGWWREPSGNPWTVNAAEVETWDGSAWNAKTGAADVNHVWGSADDDLWVTTRDCSTRHWDGSTWTRITTPATGVSGCSAQDIWGSGPSDIWMAFMVSHDPGAISSLVLFHWDGTTWSTVGPVGTELADVTQLGFHSLWGSGASDVYAVSLTSVFHFDGTSWKRVTLSGSNDFFDVGTVFGSAANDVYVGQDSHLWHWNGSVWTHKTSAIGTRAGVAFSPTDIWFTGGHYDGTLFTPMNFAVPVGSASDVWVQKSAGVGALMQTHIVGGWGGTETSKPAFFSQREGWRSPSGRTYVVSGSGGLLVHEP